MKLDNFEEQVDSGVLNRGYNYYDNKRIRKVFSTKPCFYTAIVDGSETYTVEVELSSDNNTILYTSCDCPYDYGAYCKHEVAVFCYLKEHLENQTPENSDELLSILSTMDKKELRDALETILNQNKELRERFMMERRDTGTMLEKAAFQMQQAVQKYEDSDQTRLELDDAYSVIRELYHSAYELKESEPALRLLFLILQNLGGLESTLDGENDELSDYEYDEWRQSADRVDALFTDIGQYICRILEKELDSASETEKQYLFDLVISTFDYQDFSNHTDTFCLIIESLIPYCNQPDCIKRLEKLLLPDDGDTSKVIRNYYLSDLCIKKVMINLYIHCGQNEKARALLYRNLGYSEFRSYAVDLARHAGDYQEVLRLAQDGLAQEPNRFSMYPNWQNVLYEAYEKLGDRPHMISFAEECLYSGDFDYYVRLKKLILPQDWEKWLESALEQMKNIPCCNDAYLNILKSENLQERLVAYCLDHPQDLFILSLMIAKEYRGLIEPLFLDEFSSYYKYLPTQTKIYEHLAEEIRQYADLYSPENGLRIIEKLSAVYPTRRKLHEILFPLRIKLEKENKTE